MESGNVLNVAAIAMKHHHVAMHDGRATGAIFMIQFQLLIGPQHVARFRIHTGCAVRSKITIQSSWLDYRCGRGITVVHVDWIGLIVG